MTPLAGWENFYVIVGTSLSRNGVGFTDIPRTWSSAKPQTSPALSPCGSQGRTNVEVETPGHGHPTDAGSRAECTCQAAMAMPLIYSRFFRDRMGGLPADSPWETNTTRSERKKLASELIAMETMLATTGSIPQTPVSR